MVKLGEDRTYAPDRQTDRQTDTYTHSMFMGLDHHMLGTAVKVSGYVQNYG